MGAKIAQPKPPADNSAKADADLATQGLEESSENFLSSIRLGEASAEALGYHLTDEKLTNQEVHLVVQSKEGALSSEIKKGIEDVFSGDWEGVVEIAAQALASFFGGPAPQPAEFAVNEDFKKSFLRFENDNVVQYAMYVKKTNAQSIGTLLEDSRSTSSCAICKGNVDYGKIDPQNVVSAMRDSGMPEDKVQSEFDVIKQNLKIAADVANLKRELEAGGAPKSSRKNYYKSQQTIDAYGEPIVLNTPTHEQARYDAITGEKRANVTSQLVEGIIINGTYVAPGEKKDVAISKLGGFNAVCFDGFRHTVATTLSFSAGDELSVHASAKKLQLVNSSWRVVFEIRF